MGPSLGERQWGSMREDCSDDGHACRPTMRCFRLLETDHMSVTRPIRRGIVLAAFTLSMSIANAQAQKPPVAYPDALERMNDAIDALTRKVWPSVVQISVSSY